MRLHFSLRSFMLIMAALAASLVIIKYSYENAYYVPMDDTLARLDYYKVCHGLPGPPITKRAVLERFEQHLQEISSGKSTDSGVELICLNILRTKKFPRHCGFSLVDDKLIFYPSATEQKHKIVLFTFSESPTIRHIDE